MADTGLTASDIRWAEAVIRSGCLHEPSFDKVELAGRCRILAIYTNGMRQGAYPNLSTLPLRPVIITAMPDRLRDLEEC